MSFGGGSMKGPRMNSFSNSINRGALRMERKFRAQGHSLKGFSLFKGGSQNGKNMFIRTSKGDMIEIDNRDTNNYGPGTSRWFKSF